MSWAVFRKKKKNKTQKLINTLTPFYNAQKMHVILSSCLHINETSYFRCKTKGTIYRNIVEQYSKATFSRSIHFCSDTREGKYHSSIKFKTKVEQMFLYTIATRNLREKTMIKKHSWRMSVTKISFVDSTLIFPFLFSSITFFFLHESDCHHKSRNISKLKVVTNTWAWGHEWNGLFQCEFKKDLKNALLQWVSQEKEGVCHNRSFPLWLIGQA